MKLIAIDASSSNVGCSEFEFEKNSDLILKKIQNFKLDTKLEIYQRFSDIEKYIEDKEFDVCIMEARLKSFMPGFSNKNAILSIAASNEIVSFILNKKSKYLYKFHPSSLRKAAGIKIDRKLKIDIKEYIIEYVSNNSIFNDYLKKENLKLEDVFEKREISRGKKAGQTTFIQGINDMADSFIIGLGGYTLIKTKIN